MSEVINTSNPIVKKKAIILRDGTYAFSRDGKIHVVLNLRDLENPNNRIFMNGSKKDNMVSFAEFPDLNDIPDEEINELTLSIVKAERANVTRVLQACGQTIVDPHRPEDTFKDESWRNGEKYRGPVLVRRREQGATSEEYPDASYWVNSEDIAVS